MSLVERALAACSTSASLDVNDWTTLKRTLASELPWLEPFTEPVDVLIWRRLIDARSRGDVQTFRYDPLLVQRHGTDVAQLLDRCLAYRKEARELEAAAVRNSLDFASVMNGLTADQRIAEADHDRNALEAEVSELEKAVAQYEQSNSAIAKGLAGDLRARIAERKARLLTIAERKQLVVNKLLTQQRLEEVFQFRVEAPGAAHNYCERMNRTIGLLVEDLHESLLKYSAMLRGAQEIYGIETEFLDVESESFQLDSLVNQVRRTLREIDSISQFESTFDIVIPLFRPWLPGGKSIGDYETFQKAIGTGATFSFDMSPVFDKMRRPRLQGVGISLVGSYSGEKLYDESNSRFVALLRTPSHLDKSEMSDLRPPILLGDVQFLNFADPVLYSGAGCDNCNPCGVWEMSLKPTPVEDRSEDGISFTWSFLGDDLWASSCNLHLRLALSDAGQMRGLIEEFAIGVEKEEHKDEGQDDREKIRGGGSQ